MIDEFQQTSASDWHTMGVEKYREGFFLLALEDMKKAYILNPNDEDVIKKLTKLKKLEQLASKLGLSLDTEKTLWPVYNTIKQEIKDGKKDQALAETNDQLKKYPDNPNLLHLLEVINGTADDDSTKKDTNTKK